MQHHATSVPADVLRRIYTFPQLAKDLDIHPIPSYDYWLAPSDAARAAARALYDITQFTDRMLEISAPLPPDVLCSMLHL